MVNMGLRLQRRWVQLLTTGADGVNVRDIRASLREMETVNCEFLPLKSMAYSQMRVSQADRLGCLD